MLFFYTIIIVAARWVLLLVLLLVLLMVLLDLDMLRLAALRDITSISCLVRGGGVRHRSLRVVVPRPAELLLVELVPGLRHGSGLVMLGSRGATGRVAGVGVWGRRARRQARLQLGQVVVAAGVGLRLLPGHGLRLGLRLPVAPPALPVPPPLLARAAAGLLPLAPRLLAPLPEGVLLPGLAAPVLLVPVSEGPEPSSAAAPASVLPGTSAAMTSVPPSTSETPAKNKTTI